MALLIVARGNSRGVSSLQGNFDIFPQQSLHPQIRVFRMLGLPILDGRSPLTRTADTTCCAVSACVAARYRMTSAYLFFSVWCGVAGALVVGQVVMCPM